MDWTLFFNQVVNGLSAGAIYASLALALVLIYRSTGILNFAQGEMAMFSTFLAWDFVERGLPVVAAIAAAMALSFVGGAAIERLIIRPVGDFRENPLAIVIVTIGLFVVLNGLASYVYGPQGRTFPLVFPSGAYEVGDVSISYESIGILLTLLAVVGVLFVVFQKTKLGLGMRAVASNTESSGLVGIRVGRMLMFGWGLAAAVGALAGGLIAHRDFVSTNLMQGVLIYAFAAATLGGFDSPLGAVVGGLVVGVTESLASTYIDFIGSDLKIGSAFAVILVVLLFRPQGLFGKKQVQRV